MASIEKMYWIDDNVILWLGAGSRDWLEPQYSDGKDRRIGKIKSVVPEKPVYPDELIDAYIAFLPEKFEKCKSLKAVKHKMKDTDFLDLNLGKNKIPKEWFDLRKEAKAIFRELYKSTKIYVRARDEEIR